jgi:hypothetical protein
MLTTMSAGSNMGSTTPNEPNALTKAKTKTMVLNKVLAKNFTLSVVVHNSHLPALSV